MTVQNGGRGAPEDTRDVSDEDYVEITVLSTGGILEYIIPSFPVYKATLREVKLQWEEADGIIHVYELSISVSIPLSAATHLAN